MAFLPALAVGSFLNVMIYRLPLQLQYQWRNHAREWLNLPIPRDDESAPAPLGSSRSQCTHCLQTIAWYHNIPLVSYVGLRGKCAYCGQRISLRYPLVELLTAVTSVIVVWHFGWSSQTMAALLLTWTLIVLSFIDIDHHLLPDNIVLSVLWLGLLLSVIPVFSQPVAAIIGVAAGYLILWGVFWLFKLFTGKEGMGYGDFKLLALLGAWLGWHYLPQIILFSSLIGAVIGGGAVLLRRAKRHEPIPFGPYLALAGWIALLWGGEINAAYFAISG